MKTWFQQLRYLAQRSPTASYLYDLYLLLFRTTYCGSRLLTCHNEDFLTDCKFQNALGISRQRGRDQPWQLAVALWAARHALTVDGDFVECGVWRGSLAAAIMNTIHFPPDRKFYLVDTYQGLVTSQISIEDKAARNMEYSEDTYDEVRETFSTWGNVRLVRGAVPSALLDVPSKSVAYLSLDMNCAFPETCALEYFWPKMSPGGVVLLDDYGWRGYENQKAAHDTFAQKHGTAVLPLPTGQGIIIAGRLNSVDAIHEEAKTA